MQLQTYLFDFRFSGETKYTVKHEFIDDLDALDTAEQLANDFEIEVWQGERFIARVHENHRSLTARDAQSD